MLFRKRRREPDPSTMWMKWLVIGVILYAFFAVQRPDTPENPNEMRKALNKAATELKPSNLVNFKDYKEKIFPSYVGNLRIKDITLGNGLPAVCGQEATITYETFLPDGKAFGDSATSEKPLRYVIGEQKVMPVFEQGVIGMQPGGNRSVLAPPNLSYGKEGFVREDAPANMMMRFEISLIELSPALPDPDAYPYRIAQIRGGQGVAKVCGDTVDVHVTVWGMDGKKLFDTHEAGKTPLTLTLGKSEVMVGLEQGVVGMAAGEMRTLVIPPLFQKPLRKDKPDIEIPLPVNQTVLVDVERVQ